MGAGKSESKIQYAACRFCGQMIQMDDDRGLTQPQAEEKATMLCRCSEAVEYQKEKQRKQHFTTFSRLTTPIYKLLKGLFNGDIIF